jgi:hypothetical protein
MATNPDLEQGYEKARRSHGDRYAEYLRAHNAELVAKGIAPKPWPQSLMGNDGA